ncbi:PA14 domain-containing protein [Mucilaginibacter gossypiicola]|uniref:PA14 domain-containing protein n=1 Tax=Mucilaginibacter gossypiicola TaxID=551995 RepID=A0A1H7ZWM9_9SPHI|nr:FlgD immunoglobulin-like domain containing protein [Mucilaginibacter gossypiicola]SEM62870.1 PA14 domain-containing protein [Mucilaginibacter gossypiicola]
MTISQFIKRARTCFTAIALFTGVYFAPMQYALAQDGTRFTFKLDGKAKTSAGVYSKDGTLVRTLWGGVTYNSGTHQFNWDGIDDGGRLAANGSYEVKVLSNNVKYKWEGVIGNTSDSLSGTSVHHAIERMYGMAISGNNAYFAVGYNEQSSSTFKFNIHTPQKKSVILGKGLSVKYVTTDGTNVYWAGNDAGVVNNWMVFGTKVANDSESSFTNGQPAITKYGRKYKSVLDNINNDKSEISGLAVQKHGRYLFVAHKNLNELHVLDKTTGELLQKLSFDTPLSIATDDKGHVWLIYSKNGKRIAEKFTVEANGKLNPSNVTLEGLTEPQALAISPNGKTLIVADGGDSQQLKAFDVDKGSPLWTYGTAGGYVTDPNVRNDKFYFNETKGPGTFIAFQPDGSFWVEDPGNSRAQHFTADRKFIDRIMYLQTSYSSFVDANDPSRVFSDYLEFKVDYSKPLAANNGSWQLVRNWGHNIPAEYDDKYNRLRGVATLTNGKTYALLTHRFRTLVSWKLVELPKAGPLRITSVDIPMDNTQLYPDGSLYKVSTFRVGVPTVFTKRELLKFTPDGDPIWGPQNTIAQTQPAELTDPGYHGNNTLLKSGEITSSGVIALFDGTTANCWHLGGIKVGGDKLLWRAAPSTTKEYWGPFPADGTFDIGNHTNYPGCIAMVSGRSIFWGYHGEFWKNSEVNKWTQVYDNGLFVGQFGVAGPEAGSVEAAAEMAGNCFAASVVKLPNGDTYLYHNDESMHGGVHRWKISGLSSIKEQVIPINLAVNTHGLSTESIITASGSARSYNGFVEPSYSERYEFSLKGDNIADCRLWVDGKLIVPQKGTLMELNKGTRYPVRLEVPAGVDNKNAIQLYWKSASQPEQLISDEQLYSLKSSGASSTIQLMADLPNNSTLENGRYGWKRQPAIDDSTNKYTQWWNVHTNIKSYRKTNPDIYIDFRQQNKAALLSRSLGNQANLVSWTLSGIVNFTQNCVNVGAGNSFDENNGVYLEVLDKAQKVIARVFLHSAVYRGDVSLLVNETVIYKLQYDKVKKLEDYWPRITLKMNNGRLQATFGNSSFIAVQSSNNADLKSPASVRLVCSSLSKKGGYTLGLDAWKFEKK